MEGKIKAEGLGYWEGINTLIYKSGEGHFKDIVRRTLVKNVEGIDYELRYFEVSKGGFSSLERHHHTHTVIILKGEGKVIIGDELLTAGPGDIFVISPEKAHQLFQCGDEELGFYCIVSNERDKPTLLSEEEKRVLYSKLGIDSIL